MARFMGNNQNGQMLSLCITVAILFLGVRSELNQDIKGCQDSMSDLYSCLPFVTNKAKTPDSTCCNTLKEKLDKGQTKRCLCVLVKDRDDPGLGFKVDANRAMSLPSTCHVPANISQCPGEKFQSQISYTIFFLKYREEYDLSALHGHNIIFFLIISLLFARRASTFASRFSSC